LLLTSLPILAEKVGVRKFRSCGWSEEEVSPHRFADL
jgi:hypothetical protein